MSAVLQKICPYILQSIEFHSAWLGEISGLEAEKLLRGKNQPYLYVLRTGEASDNASQVNFYVTYVRSDLTIMHQPFTITMTSEGWLYENGTAGGPFLNEAIDDVLHCMMHCKAEECFPLVLS